VRGQTESATLLFIRRNLMRKTNALAIAAVFAVFAAAAVQTAASPEKSASAARLEVTYYYLPT
jgi:hypothetical protein